MRVRIAALLPLLAALGIAGPPAALAQATPAAASGAGQTVPMELALALLSGYGPTGEERPAIVVGRLPETFPRDALPPDATVLGGVAYPAGRSTAVAAVPQPATDALASYAAFVERAGWRRVPEFGSRGGFVPGPTSGPPLLFCRDSASLNVLAIPRTGGGSHLRFHLFRGDRFAPCGRDGRAMLRSRMGDEMDDAPMPTLQAPARVVTLGGSTMGGGPNSRETSARLQAELGPAELVAHYAGQLRQAGWTLDPAATGKEFAAQSAQLRDSAGRTWRGLLTAVALPGTREREVVFRMLRPAGTGQ